MWVYAAGTPATKPALDYDGGSYLGPTTRRAPEPRVLLLRAVSAMALRRPRFHFIHNALAGRPRVLVALVAVIAVVVFMAGGWAAWFSYELTAGLPDKKALKAIGDMAQATTLLDAADRPAFTIFKEQRLEIPIEKMSPNLIKAVVSVEDQRFYEHSCVDAVRVAAAVVRNF